MELQESQLARVLLAAGLPSQMHSRLGSGSNSSPCTPAMQRAHFSQVRTPTHKNSVALSDHLFGLNFINNPPECQSHLLPRRPSQQLNVRHGHLPAVPFLPRVPDRRRLLGLRGPA